MSPLYDKVEAVLIKVLVGLLALIVIFQLLAASPSAADAVVLLNRLEGTVYAGPD